MVYLYLALSGILDGGVIFGAKVLSNLGASLFELMIYPNLLSVLFIAYFARCDLHKLWRIPLKMKFLFAAALWGHAKQGRRVEVCCLFAMLAYAYMEVQPFHLTTNPTALLLCGAVFAQASARWQKIE